MHIILDICYLFPLLTEIALTISTYWWNGSGLFCWHICPCSEWCYHVPNISCLEQAQPHDTIESNLCNSTWGYVIPSQSPSKNYGDTQIKIETQDGVKKSHQIDQESRMETYILKKSDIRREKLCYQNDIIPQQV